MSLKSYYAQKCPSCQKMLSIDVETLGFRVVCRHCESEFTAKDHAQSSAAMEDPINFWVNFTDHSDKNRDSVALHYPETFLDKSPRHRPR